MMLHQRSSSDTRHPVYYEQVDQEGNVYLIEAEEFEGEETEGEVLAHANYSGEESSPGKEEERKSEQDEEEEEDQEEEEKGAMTEDPEGGERSQRAEFVDPIIARVGQGDLHLQESAIVKAESAQPVDVMGPNYEERNDYTFRELARIRTEEGHALSDFIYKLFLVSLTYSESHKYRSFAVFKTLLERVRMHSC